MLRLSEENFFAYYQQFSRAIKDWLQLHDHEAAGAFPVELSRLNVYHAAQSSSRRIRALRLIESLTDNEQLPLLHLAVMHSNQSFCSRYQGVFYDGVHIPRALVRQHTVPVCPDCLNEAGYIRQEWHWIPYQACLDHGVRLVHECPKCGDPLSYIVNESLYSCTCGMDIRHSATSRAEGWQIEASRLVMGVLDEASYPLLGLHSISMRFTCLLWFQLYSHQGLNESGQVDTNTLKDAMEYFSHWPEIFNRELEARAANAENFLLQDFNRTRLQHVFGDIIRMSHLLVKDHTERDFILIHLEDFLVKLVNRHPKNRVPNLADLLLSVPEASVLLGTSHEQVYRLYQEGYLKLAFRLKGHEKLTGGVGAFHLREVIELRQSRVPMEGSVYNNYLSAW